MTYTLTLAILQENFASHSSKSEAENGPEIVMVVIYISPDQNMDGIIIFIHGNLIIDTIAGSALL